MARGKHRADTGTIPVPKIPRSRTKIKTLVEALFETVAAQEQQHVSERRELDRLAGLVARR